MVKKTYHHETHIKIHSPKSKYSFNRIGKIFGGRTYTDITLLLPASCEKVNIVFTNMQRNIKDTYTNI